MTVDQSRDWRPFVADSGWALEGDQITVTLSTGRRQTIHIQPAADGYHLMTIVASATDLAGIPDLDLTIWQRNRRARLAAFRLTPEGQLIGEAHCPAAGLTAPEFQLLVRNLALEADRVEYLLTGKDVW